MSDICDNDKAKKQRKHRERLSGGQAGKGDAPRNNRSEAYRLGALMMELGQAVELLRLCRQRLSR